MEKEKKGIGKGELIALIVSSCIGTGIFGITSDVAAAAAPGPALLAWIFVGIGFLMLVLSLNNLSEKRPDLTAGIFSYAVLVSDQWVNLFPVGHTGYLHGLVTLPSRQC